MDWIVHENKKRSLLLPAEQPYYLPQSPQQNLQSDSFNLNNKVGPSILLITIIITIIFFVSGLLHLLVRFLLRHANGDQPEDLDNNVTDLQGQLQQLFHLHDAGVEKSFIDTLPVFHYKSVIGVKSPFDCAVCLCEFEPEDKLRLLPKCRHGFHMECIDTWLLSHSTCPLCRASLLPDFSAINDCSPMVFVFESGIESSREIVTDTEGLHGRSSSVLRSNSNLGLCGDIELGSPQRKSCEILENDELKPIVMVDSGQKVMSVKLGKFRNVDGGEGSSNNDNGDARRCFSMGSFEYVMDENSFLKVPIRTPLKKPSSSKKTCLPLTPAHRRAMSECESRRGFNGFEITRNFETNGSCSTSDNNGKGAFGKSKKESFSISKIWLRGKKDKQNFAEDSSRRAFSFRFPQQHPNVAATPAGVDDGSLKVKNSIAGDRDTIELGCDEVNQSCYSLDSQTKTPSFARRTVLWLAGRQNKVSHSSFTPKV